MQPERIAFLSVAMVLLSGAAMADDASQSGLYARLEGGLSFPENLKQDVAQQPNIITIPEFPNRWTVKAGAGYAAGGAIGFRYENGVRTELEYRYQSSDIDGVDLQPFGPTISPDASLTAHLLMTNVIFEFRNASPLTPYIGGGVGGAWVKSVFEFSSATETDLTYAYQGRAGIALAVNRTTRLGVEYVYVRTGELRYGPEEFPPAPPPLVGPKISEGEFAASTVLVSFEKSF